MNTGWSRMKGAHAGGSNKGSSKTEKYRGYHDSYHHSWNPDSKEVSECRGKAESSVLKTHAVNKTEPKIGDEINI